MSTRLYIYRDKGNILYRAIAYMKMSPGIYAVRIKNRDNQELYLYDKNHMDFSKGSYDLVFFDRNREEIATLGEPLHVFDNNRGNKEKYIIYRWGFVFSQINISEVSHAKVQRMMEKGRLCYSANFNEST